MRFLGIVLVAALFAQPISAIAQFDPNWSQREMERMQAEQERFNAQVERQRAEQERFQAQAERQRAEMERITAKQQADMDRMLANQNVSLQPMSSAPSAGGCALCGLVTIFEGSAKRRHSKAVGRLLAQNDCSGAAKYALSKGDLDLASEVKDYCGRHAPTSQKLRPQANWLKVEVEPDGTTYFVDANSIRQVGDLYAWRMHVIYPAANTVKELSVSNLYRCTDRRNAIKSFVVYRRNGDVQHGAFESRDLKFDPLRGETATERALIDQVCS